jgi:predicted secreted protein
MTFILLVTIIWLINIFIALPVGNKMPIKPKIGHADSAPEVHHIGLKLLITFVISIILALCYKWVLSEFPGLYNLIKY